jgi:hypothetical protein
MTKENASTSTVENCALRNSSPKKRPQSQEAQSEEKWREHCRNEAPALYKQLLEGDFQPKLDVGNWFIAKYAEVLALFPDHKKKAQTAWKSLFKTKDFPTTNKPWTYETADRFMAIAKCEFIQNTDNWPHLPNAWSTLYEMTKLNQEQFERGKSLKLKWTRKSINNLRKPPKRKPPQNASQPDGFDDHRDPFGPGDDEPPNRWELTLTGPCPLYLVGEASTNTLQYFRRQIRNVVKVATETRPDFKCAGNAERSDAI